MFWFQLLKCRHWSLLKICKTPTEMMDKMGKKTKWIKKNAIIKMPISQFLSNLCICCCWLFIVVRFFIYCAFFFAYDVFYLGWPSEKQQKTELACLIHAHTHTKMNTKKNCHSKHSFQMEFDCCLMYYVLFRCNYD